MKRLEIIHLRLANTCSNEFIESICNSYKEKYPLCIYRNERLSGDIGIHIMYDSTMEEKLPSTPGLSLASILREYGMVDHSIWKEQCSANGKSG